MKLKVPKLYGQRDGRWASELLGYNTNPIYSIGQYGCLITSFGMYIDQTPHEVNEVVKANNGFAPGSGNFIWSKCSVLGLSQVYQSPYYADAVTNQGLTKMRSLLDEGRPLITHIDFDPRDADDDQHWILVYGYDENDVFYALDPWTGTAITLDVYGGVKRCVYEWRAYDKILPNDTQVDQECMPKSQAEDFRRVKEGWNQIRAKLNVEDSVTVVLADIDKLLKIEEALRQAEKKNGEDLEEIRKLKDQVQVADDKYKELKNKVEKVLSDVNIAITDNAGVLGALDELETRVSTPVVVKDKPWYIQILEFFSKKAG